MHIGCFGYNIRIKKIVPYFCLTSMNVTLFHLNTGLGLMLLLIPFNAVISMKQRKLQVDLMKFKDKRLKLMSEVLSGMKVHIDTYCYLI